MKLDRTITTEEIVEYPIGQPEPSSNPDCADVHYRFFNSMFYWDED